MCIRDSLWLGREGYDTLYGARPLRRAVTRFLENPLSKGILSGDFTSGDHILVDSADDNLVLSKVNDKKPNIQRNEADGAVTLAN